MTRVSWERLPPNGMMPDGTMDKDREMYRMCPMPGDHGFHWLGQENLTCPLCIYMSHARKMDRIPNIPGNSGMVPTRFKTAEPVDDGYPVEFEGLEELVEWLSA